MCAGGRDSNPEPLSFLADHAASEGLLSSLCRRMNVQAVLQIPRDGRFDIDIEPHMLPTQRYKHPKF